MAEMPPMQVEVQIKSKAARALALSLAVEASSTYELESDDTGRKPTTADYEGLILGRAQQFLDWLNRDDDPTITNSDEEQKMCNICRQPVKPDHHGGYKHVSYVLSRNHDAVVAG